jgi:hypothetical protein
MEIGNLMKAGKLFSNSIVVVFILLVLICSPVLAQTPETPLYRLNINRDFGYGLGADIKGLFTLRIVGPEDLESVSYFIDGELMAELDESPFTYQFNTNQYPFGAHDLTAVVTNVGGETLTTPARLMNFVSPEEQTAGTQKILIPIILLVVGIMLVTGLMQSATMRKRNPNGVEPGTQRNFGYAGGSICKHCGRPTPRHIWGFNIAIGKFDRCENCGKWSVMQAAPYEILRAAEIAEKSESDKPTFNEKTDEEKLRELIDKSKFD